MAWGSALRGRKLAGGTVVSQQPRQSQIYWIHRARTLFLNILSIGPRPGLVNLRDHGQVQESLQCDRRLVARSPRIAAGRGLPHSGEQAIGQENHAPFVTGYARRPAGSLLWLTRDVERPRSHVDYQLHGMTVSWSSGNVACRHGRRPPPPFSFYFVPCAAVLRPP